MININPDAVSAGQLLFVTVTDEAGNATEGIEIVVPGDGEGSAAGAVLAFFRRKSKN